MLCVCLSLLGTVNQTEDDKMRLELELKLEEREIELREENADANEDGRKSCIFA